MSVCGTFFTSNPREENKSNSINYTDTTDNVLNFPNPTIGKYQLNEEIKSDPISKEMKNVLTFFRNKKRRNDKKIKTGNPDHYKEKNQ